MKRYHTVNNKISVHVQLPSLLNLSEFTVSKTCSMYSLAAIICHKGNLDTGHYVAYCKNPTNNEWYKYDDKNVNLKTESDVLKQQAYLAFYTENSPINKTPSSV